MDKICRLSVDSLAVCPIELVRPNNEMKLLINSEKAVPLAIATSELIHNSIAHGFKGMEDGVLIVSASVENGMLHTCVKNNGHILDTHFSTKSFDLGLQIVRTLVEIELNGSFILKIKEIWQKPISESLYRLWRTKMSETYRIVIADDEAIICMDLKEILEEAGHEVVGICADGVRALELVKEEKPDLVILDVQMPKLDGLQAAKLIAHDDLAPVVLLTAYSDAETVEKAKRSHVFGYVMKPVEERNLFPALQIAVSQYRSRHEIAHRVKEMERELASRKIINRAKGLLMDYYHISDEEAYHKMQQTSMRRGILLTDVAQKVIKEIMVRKNMLS